MNSILLYSLILGSDAVLVIYVDTYILGIVIVNEVLEVSPWTSIANRDQSRKLPFFRVTYYLHTVYLSHIHVSSIPPCTSVVL
jgi:hypothetical protein